MANLLVSGIHVRRPNDTTDLLAGAWRVLTAHTLAEGLRKGKWEETTMQVTEREVTVDTYRIVVSHLGSSGHLVPRGLVAEVRNQ
jgi:hypothetical protein